jgi:hypothetical protein
VSRGHVVGQSRGRLADNLYEVHERQLEILVLIESSPPVRHLGGNLGRSVEDVP